MIYEKFVQTENICKKRNSLKKRNKKGILNKQRVNIFVSQSFIIETRNDNWIWLQGIIINFIEGI